MLYIVNIDNFPNKLKPKYLLVRVRLMVPIMLLMLVITHG